MASGAMGSRKRRRGDHEDIEAWLAHESCELNARTIALVRPLQEEFKKEASGFYRIVERVNVSFQARRECLTRALKEKEEFEKRFAHLLVEVEECVGQVKKGVQDLDREDELWVADELMQANDTISQKHRAFATRMEQARSALVESLQSE